MSFARRRKLFIKVEPHFICRMDSRLRGNDSQVKLIELRQTKLIAQINDRITQRVGGNPCHKVVPLFACLMAPPSRELTPYFSG